MQPSSSPPASVTPPAVGPSTTEPIAIPATGLSIPAVAATIKALDLVPATPASRRYDKRVGPAPPSPSQPRPSWRALPRKRAQTSGPSESSILRPQEPQSSPVQGPAIDFSPDLSPTSIIRCPIFHCGPITGNSNCSTKEVHNKTYYYFPAFVVDSMRIMHRYSLEHFITPRRFFHPRVVIEFYHTMTSRWVPHPTSIHFSIDGSEGTLRASNIAATFNFPIVIDNSFDYRLWPHLSPRDMVSLLSRVKTIGSILFRRELPPCMLLIDHILRSNLIPLQYIV